MQDCVIGVELGRNGTHFFFSFWEGGSNKQVYIVTGFLVKWMFKALKPHSAHFYSLTRRVKPWEKQLDVPRIWVSIEYASVLGRRRQWHPTPVLLPGKSHGRRSLEGCSPWGRWRSDTTERLHFHFSLKCIGEGNGNPLQCSCLENPRDGGAWWAAVSGVAQSRTWLKRLSSSSSSSVLGLP